VRVGNLLAQSVRQQKGRAHLVHILLIERPPAGVREGLGFNQDLLRRHRHAAQQQS
jgi:hypothetical protein